MPNLRRKYRGARYVYDYRIEVKPSPDGNVTGYVSMAYNKVDQDHALRDFFRNDFKVARVNGVRRGINQMRKHLSITRIRSHLIGA